MSLTSKLKELADVISAAPINYAVIPVPAVGPFSDGFILPTSVDSRHLQSAISSGLPIILASTITPSDNPTATDLQPFAVKAEICFKGPENGGRAAVVFDTGERIAVRYSDHGGGIRATARAHDFRSI